MRAVGKSSVPKVATDPAGCVGCLVPCVRAALSFPLPPFRCPPFLPRSTARPLAFPVCTALPSGFSLLLCGHGVGLVGKSNEPAEERRQKEITNHPRQN